MAKAKAKTVEAPVYEGKDVYALIKETDKGVSRVTWDVRKHDEANDDKLATQAENWGRKLVKVVEDGQPLYEKASAASLKEIPERMVSVDSQPKIVADTLKHVQNGLDLKEHKRAEQIATMTVGEALAPFKGRDAYALVADPNAVDTKVTWDIRKHSPENDLKLELQADNWKRTAVKVIENGKPIHPNLTVPDVLEIPQKMTTLLKQPEVVQKTYELQNERVAGPVEARADVDFAASVAEISGEQLQLEL